MTALRMLIAGAVTLYFMKGKNWLYYVIGFLLAYAILGIGLN